MPSQECAMPLGTQIEQLNLLGIRAADIWAGPWQRRECLAKLGGTGIAEWHQGSSPRERARTHVGVRLSQACEVSLWHSAKHSPCCKASLLEGSKRASCSRKSGCQALLWYFVKEEELASAFEFALLSGKHHFKNVRCWYVEMKTRQIRGIWILIMGIIFDDKVETDF